MSFKFHALSEAIFITLRQGKLSMKSFRTHLDSVITMHFKTSVFQYMDSSFACTHMQMPGDAWEVFDIVKEGTWGKRIKFLRLKSQLSLASSRSPHNSPGSWQRGAPDLSAWWDEFMSNSSQLWCWLKSGYLGSLWIVPSNCWKQNQSPKEHSRVGKRRTWS